MKILALVSAAICLAAPAFAGDITIRVVDAAGAAVPNAVIFLDGETAAPAPDSFAWPNMMEQVDIQFAPYVLIAPLGSDVEFPNRDRVRHHVYSFAKGNRFELKLYGREESRAITFETPGIVAVGCNIHDGMIGYIRVVDTAFAAKSDAAGHASLSALPAGGGTLTIWHPDMNAGQDIHVSYSDGQSEIVAKFADVTVGHSRHH